MKAQRCRCGRPATTSKVFAGRREHLCPEHTPAADPRFRRAALAAMNRAALRRKKRLARAAQEAGAA